MSRKCGLPVCLFLFVLGAGCGSSGTTDANDDNVMLTEKLVGTPFEGLTTGDDFEAYHFFCGEYRTETISSTTIPVFAAFFTRSEEETIQEGIDLANEAIGFEAFQLIGDWANDLRVIYKVNEIQHGDSPVEDSRGEIEAVIYNFNENYYAERIVPDWAIELREDGISERGVAHELGHAMGLEHDCLIDYENNTCLELEENSIMSGDRLGSALADYTFMMQKQGEIMLNHLNDTSGTLDTGNCGDE